MSSAGHKYINTPNLDALAQRGIQFTRAFAQNPICMPSRASMMTGEYLSSCGMYAFGGILPRRVNYLYDPLKEAGYVTGAMGKFHLACIQQDRWCFDYSAPTLPEDVDYSTPVGNNYDTYSEQHGIKRPSDQIHGHYPVLGKSDPAKDAWHRVSSKADKTKHLVTQRHAESDVPEEHSLERYTANRCIEFLEEHAPSDKPMFAYCSFDRPHYPGSLPKEWHDRIDPDSIELDDLPDARQLAKMVRSRFDFYSTVSSIVIGDDDFRFVLATYFKLIELIDFEIGRIIDKLKALGIEDDTTIVFTADHGDNAGYGRLYDKNKAVSPDIVRVPLIVVPAKSLNAKGLSRVVDEPVELVDIAPTICGLHNIDIPDSWQGVDLSPSFIEGHQFDEHRAVFCEEYYRIAVYQDNYMLVAYMDNPAEWALYDLAVDIHGKENLFYEPNRQAVRIKLMRSIMNHYAQVQFGPVTQADRDAYEKAMNGADHVLPVSTGGSLDGLSVMGAYISIRCKDPDNKLVVPRYDSDIMMFEGDYGYVNKSVVLPYDGNIIEQIMILTIPKLMRRVISNGSFEEQLHNTSLPAKQEIKELLERT